MRRSFLAVLIILLVLCASCAQNEQSNGLENQPIVEKHENRMDANCPTPEPTITPKIWTELEWTEIGEYIPNLILGEEYMSNSNDTLYEDDLYIYYLKSSRGDLICIDKKSGDVELITSDCCDFTLCKGKVYYVDNKDGAEDEEAFYNYIEVYDVKTHTTTSCIRRDESIVGLACYGDKLFFTCTPNRDFDEKGCVLYRANLDGTEVDKLGDDVDSFCVYKENLYMVTTGDLGFIHKYDYDSNTFEQVYEGAVSSNFSISLNRLFCYEYRETHFKSSNVLVLNIDSLDKKEYPLDFSNNVAGQYIIFIERDENNNLILKAYDYLSEKGYVLLDLTDIIDDNERCSIHVTVDNIYLCIDKPHEFQVYRIWI